MPRPRALIPIALIAALLVIRACVVTDPLSRLAAGGEARPSDPKGVTIYTGSLLVERGGPVVLGFQGAGSRLEIDGREMPGQCHGIADGTVCRVLLPPGPHALRFGAMPGARLVWSPVGRRGEPTYVQPSSLSPDPPASATFSCADTAYADGAIALAIFAIVIATLLALVRERLALVSRERWLAMGAVFVVAVLARWIDLNGFGQTWDEDTNWSAGRNYVTNLLSLDLHDRSWAWNGEHPPVMKYLEGIGAQLSGGFGPARAMSAIWIALGCALLVPIGARLYSARAGILAGGIAALLPPLVAHGQIVGHEAPTVLWWALGILLALCVHDGLPEVLDARGRRTLAIRLVWVGVVIGVATCSRFVNGLLGPLCAVIVVERSPAAWRRETVVRGAAILPVVALATFYVLWPRIWFHPIDKLSESYAKLSTTHGVEPFLGAMREQPPPYYFLAYLVATLPLAVLAGVVIGGVHTARRRGGSGLVMLAWFALPLVVMASPVRQDGVRYVLPSVMALAMLGAAGWDRVATWLERRTRHAFTAVCVGLAGYLVVVLVRVHPYYLDYFGEQVGGARTVAARRWFETAWWGEGVDRAVDYINEHAKPGDVVYRDCIPPVHLAWFDSSLWAAIDRHPPSKDATWILWYAPAVGGCPIPHDARLVFEVDNDGLVLAQVWQRGT